MTTARKKRMYGWLFYPKTAPSIFDADLASVYSQGPWIKIIKTEGVILSQIIPSHPKDRLDWPPNLNHVHYVKELKDLPKWMRERIALLRIVPGVWVPSVGKCWDDRYYTFDWILK